MDLLWPILMVLMSTIYIVLGVSTVTISIEIGNGFVAFLAAIFYLTYILILIAVWSFIGTYFEDSVSVRHNFVCGLEEHGLLYSAGRGRISRILLLRLVKHEDINPEIRAFINAPEQEVTKDRCSSVLHIKSSAVYGCVKADLHALCDYQ